MQQPTGLSGGILNRAIASSTPHRKSLLRELEYFFCGLVTTLITGWKIKLYQSYTLNKRENIHSRGYT
ncbi:MAG: hypothetical protein DSM107014_04490 [Gomphosphaeria aponina SAG 52.96 = DSM 107014]|uniref:Uncharacterized protein n=1 Tax=Gomphosphaeria aponina SAG 52.96 = DSM 107014 TaxID=1521640 RepID=A0A941JRM9_9CHRO|nr:hypothetical protein [Gomphosphaeria aponina SAG 52.96 = DSM 107014]